MDPVTIQDVLGRLKGVRANGRDKWMACCPAHDDKDASLSVSQGRDGVLMKCFAGCEFPAICGALGIEPRAMFRDQAERKRGCTLAEYAAAKGLDAEKLRKWGCSDILRPGPFGESPAVEMLYMNAAGETMATRYRINLAKGQDGQDRRFLWQKGSRTGLYGLWRLPADPAAPLLIVEGESDTQTLWQADFAAVGLPGAGNWREDRDAAHLAKFSNLYLILEPDNGGFSLWQAFAGDAERGRPRSSLADRIKVFTVGTGPKKDASGLYLSDRAAFQANLEAAMAAAVPLLDFNPPAEWRKKTDKRAATSPENGKAGAEHGDKGGRPPINYYRLALEFLESYRHGPDRILTLRMYRDAWYQWNGRYYDGLMDGAVEARVMAFLQTPAAALLGGGATRNCTANVLANLRSTNLCYLDPMLSAPCWVSTGAQAHGWLPMANMMVNVRATGKFLAEMAEVPQEERIVTDDDTSAWSKPLTPDLFVTYGLPYAFDMTAACSGWHTYLDKVQPSIEGRAMIQAMAGLAMVPDTRFNVAFFLFGQPGTGKSVFLHVIQHMVGLENCCSVPLVRFGEKHSTWPLTEKLLNVVGDLETDDGHGSLRHLEGTFKDICDGSWIPIERKNKDVSRGRVTARCLFATNSLPTFADRTEAMWDRLRIIPFDVRIRSTKDENPNLRHELVETELPGLFNWALLGLGRLEGKRQFPEHPEGLERKREHKGKCDLERTYLEDTYDIVAGAVTDAAEAYKDFRAWLQEGGFANRTRNTFNESVWRVFGIRETRPGGHDDTSRQRRFVGIVKKATPVSVSDQDVPSY